MASFVGTFVVLHLVLLIDFFFPEDEAIVFILSERKVYISIILDLFAFESQEKTEAKHKWNRITLGRVYVMK